MGELVPANHFYQQNVVRNPKPNAQMVQNLLIETRRNIVATVKGLREVSSLFISGCMTNSTGEKRRFLI